MSESKQLARPETDVLESQDQASDSAEVATNDPVHQIWSAVEAGAIHNLDWNVMTSVVDAIDQEIDDWNSCNDPLDPDTEDAIRNMGDVVIGCILYRASEELDKMGKTLKSP